LKDAMARKGKSCQREVSVLKKRTQRARQRGKKNKQDDCRRQRRLNFTEQLLHITFGTA